MTHVKRMSMQGFKSFAPKTEIFFDKGINTIVGPNGSGKSTSYDTIVTLADGSEVQIGEFIDEQIKISKVIKKLDDGIYVDGNGDFEVISLNKLTMKAEKKKISKFIKRKGDPLYLIKTRSGRELKATKCHPIMSFVDGEVKSKVISSLDIGSFIACPRKLDFQSTKENMEFSRLMGYIIGDGYIAKDRIDFINKDTEVIQDFESLLLKHTKNIRKFIKKDVSVIYTRDKEFYKKIRSFYKGDGSVTSAEKTIPNHFLTLNNKSIANLLAGLFDTDGSVRKDAEIIEYCTKNKNLARQIQSILLRFGINSKIKERMCFASNTKKKEKRKYYYVYIYGVENISRFYENIPIRVAHKKANLKKIVESEIASNSNVDIIPREINFKIKKLAQLLGIKYKPLRKKYPSLAAYIENRCSPSREGIEKIIPLLNEKFMILHEKYNSLEWSRKELVGFMDMMNISSRQVSEGIGLHQTIIRNYWANERFNPKLENLINFKLFIKNVFLTRIKEISETLILLQNLARSDIYWDEIVEIRKLETPEFVYDLTVEGNHNFVANNIFAHNSNISDALCFALGRLSVKSMRAAKAKNLLFMGTKSYKPSKEAWVELVFDNQNKTFNLPEEEVKLKRIVRHNGQSIYKINDETKTRSEVVETLAQAGIDPYGFNIILQGNIQSFVRIPSEERRKILEEVAGISIYESRKEKALKELEKTESRLKEISTVLRERSSFLRNLESERAQALKFKDLETTIKRCKASITNRKKEEKEKELESVRKSIEEKTSQRNKLKEKSDELQNQIDSWNQKINQINKYIQQSTGLEQDALHDSITNLKAELEGLRVRKENYENRKEEIENRIEQMNSSIPDYESEINDLRTESPLVAKKQEELKKKKEELAKLEEEKKNAYAYKTEFNSIKERLKEKSSRLSRIDAESDSLLKQIEEYSQDFKYSDEIKCKKEIDKLEKELDKLRTRSNEINREELEKTKLISSHETEIKSAEKIKSQITDIDVCPLCQNKMTEEHMSHVNSDSDTKIKEAKENINLLEKEINNLLEERSSISSTIKSSESLLSSAQRELSKHGIVKDKKEYLKSLVEEQKILQEELKKLEEKRDSLEKKTYDLSGIEERYSTKMLEIEEISSRTEKDLDTTLLYKERELEKLRESIKQNKRDLKEIEEEIGEISESIENKNSVLEKKEEEDEKLQEKFKQMFKERDELQERIQQENYNLSTLQSESRQIEDQVNYLKVGNAKLDAERESLEMELTEYRGIELIKDSLAKLQERLQKAQTTINTIGSINMRALEIYDEIKDEYEKVKEKADTIEKEKENIIKIIEEVDNKKKRTFMRTFKGINELFNRNFSQLSTKGEASLEIENPEDIFSGGVGISIKMAKGKYFDVTSLSGGEQTLIALSLLFAIQEYKPYHFYIFDEIDAALDKRNSERLSALLRKYMQHGQYIVVTHNDAIITDSNFLYGVSMHDGISKILSLKLD